MMRKKAIWGFVIAFNIVWGNVLWQWIWSAA